MTYLIEKTVQINAPASAVWKTLTEPALMKQWMGDPETEIDIQTNWLVNGPIVISGFHHMKFENKGTVLEFEPGQALKYNFLSSLSRLPDLPENYTVIEFTLCPADKQTALTLVITNFPTETIYRHLDFYWRTTIELIKQLAEKNAPSAAHI
jgi:uncharacterized protein YndB with AHSA1/START domain